MRAEEQRCSSGYKMAPCSLRAVRLISWQLIWMWHLAAGKYGGNGGWGGWRWRQQPAADRQVCPPIVWRDTQHLLADSVLCLSLCDSSARRKQRPQRENNDDPRVFIKTRSDISEQLLLNNSLAIKIIKPLQILNSVQMKQEVQVSHLNNSININGGFFVIKIVGFLCLL